MAFARGEGCWLEATNGQRYLDFGAGIAVCCLGHSHPHLVEALITQGRTSGLILSGYTLGADFIREMQGLVVAKGADSVTVDQAMLPGGGLWLRAEPGEDGEQAAILAALIHAGLRAEAGA